MPAGVNLLGFSTDLSHALWSFSAAGIDYTPGTHAAPPPGRGTPAGTIHFFAPGPGLPGMRTHVPVPNDAMARNCSTYIRKVPAAAPPARYPILRVKYETGGVITATYILVDLLNGVAYPSVTYPPDDWGIVVVGTEWLRVWVDLANNNSGNTELEFAYYPCWSNDLDPDTPGPAGDASVVVWGPQVTEGAGILTYMSTPNYGRAIVEYERTRRYY